MNHNPHHIPGIVRSRKRPVVVLTAVITTTNIHGLLNWCNGIYRDKDSFIVPTKEGNMIAHVGDVLICGVEGEFYPCKRTIFDATYEPADHNP